MALHAHAEASTAPYVIPADSNGNLIVCFSEPIPGSGTITVTGFTPQVDREDRVARMVLYRDQAVDTSTPLAGPVACGDGQGSIGTDWVPLYGWVPSNPGLTFPADLGMPMRGGQRLVLQVHYHPTGDGTDTDQSGIALHTSAGTRAEVGVVAVSSLGFTVSAASPTVTTECHTPMSLMGFTIPLPTTHVRLSFPMMNTHGQSIRTELIHGGQTTATFGEADPFPPVPRLYQPEDVLWTNGDTLRVTCTYGGFLEGESVGMGDRAEDEACLELLYISPPVKALGAILVPACPLPQ